MTDWTARDNEISQKVKLHPDTCRLTQKFTSAETVACDTPFHVTRSGNQFAKKRRVPWWTKNTRYCVKKPWFGAQFSEEKKDDNLRLERRQQYQESNRIYQMRLREEKQLSWKDFCSKTNSESSNPWNGAYSYSAGRQRNKLILTNLNKGNNNYTMDMETTINQMIEP